MYHRATVEKCPQMLRDMMSLPLDDSPLFKAFKTKPDCLDDDEWNSVLSEVKEIIETQVVPSYLNLAKFMDDVYIPNTRTSLGCTSLPNGEAYYAAVLAYHTSTDLPPEEIAVMGTVEVNRIRGRMEALKTSVGFKGSMEEFQTHLNDDDRFKFKDADEILDYYKQTVANIQDKLSEYFHRLPTTGYNIVPELAEIAPSMPMGRYDGPTTSGSCGTFYVNTSKPESRRKYDALALALHEAIPGKFSYLRMAAEFPLIFFIHIRILNVSLYTWCLHLKHLFIYFCHRFSVCHMLCECSTLRD